MAKENSKKINGWLLFFIITLVFFAPIFNLYVIYSERETITILDMIDMLASISLFIISGIFLWIRKPCAVRFTKIVLISTFVINIISMLILWDFSYATQRVVYFLIWIPYLYNSEQLKQIYPAREESNGASIWPLFAIIYTFISPFFGAIFAISGLMSNSNKKKIGGKILLIIALILSIIYITSLIWLGALESSRSDYAPDEITNQCNDFCYGVKEKSTYTIEYNTEILSYVCYCIDDNSKIINKKSFPYE